MFGLLGSLCLGYLHYGLFPGRLKITAVRILNDLTQTKVNFDKVLWLPFEGLSFHNLSVHDKTDHPLFSAKKLSANIRLFLFLKEKKIIVSNVVLESPVYDAVLEPKKIIIKSRPPMTKISGEIEVPVVSDEKKIDLESIEEGPDFFLPENVYLEQIEISNGSMTLRKKPEDPIIEEIRSINIRMAFQRPPDLLFDGFICLGRSPYAQVSLKGSWNLKSGVYAFALETHSEKIPEWLLAYQKNNWLILKNGRFILQTHLSSINNGKTYFRSEAKLYDSKIQVKNTEYSGRINISAKGLFDMDSKKITRYLGRLDLLGVDVKNLSAEIHELKNLQGKISFKPDLLTLDGVAGQYHDLGFKAYGSLQSFTEEILNATIYTDSKISQVLALLSEEQKKLIGDLELQGNCQAVTTIRGTLKNAKDLKTDHKILVTNGSIKSSDRKLDFSKISAEILLNESGYQIKQCVFTFLKETYVLNAFIPKPPETLRTLALHSKVLDLDAVYTLEKNTILIKKASANAYGMHVHFIGRMLNPKNPYLDIEGTTEISLNRTRKELLLSVPQLKDIELEGTLNGPFILKGLWNTPVDWDLRLDMNGDPIFVKKSIRLDKLEMHIRMKDKKIHIPYFHAKPYGGSLGLDGWFEPSKPEIPFEGKVFASNINVAALSKDLRMKAMDLAGTAVFQAVMKGHQKFPETYLGNGSLDIRNGKLWKTDLFKAMSKLPFLKVEGLDLVTFHDASTTFDIHDKRIWTNNLNLLSDTVDLSLKGSMGFDLSLDFLMDIQYSKNVMLGAMDTGGLAPFIVGQAGDFISQYKISGTLKDSKYDKVGLPVGRVIGKKISSLLGS
ncbi:MAG: hypothetical protein AUJ72_01885 [Candidatus Omnitrophica bacterium CG1_02_46_14]|nr:MAG: hypothetical protein AUJ72_01885 [Candidatus Omnitrophica bacterium CG1_02_46_14]